MNKKLLSLMLASGVVLGVSQVFAGPVNITILDNATTTYGFNGGPLGQGLEDNETEKANGVSTVQSQVWDMEAFVVKGTKLYIIGGYNMNVGQDNLKPGDLFIRVTSTNTAPGYSPNAANSGPTITNAGLGYTRVVDLTQATGNGVTSGSASVYALGTNSVFDSVQYDQLNSNPWRYSNSNNSAPAIASALVTYYSAQSNANIASLTGLNLGLKDNTGFTGYTHNVLEVDLGFLVGVNDNVFFSYTMECGNDSLKGKYTGGFYRTPDGASSILLISLGLAAMAFFGLNRRR